MSSATLAEIRKELRMRSPEELVELCGRLARYKKDNKEFLNYLLFASEDEGGYVEQVKSEVSQALAATNTSGFYLAKKSVRRALRIADKYIKYSSVPETEVEIRIHFCEQLKKLDLNWRKSKVLTNLYNRQVNRIRHLYAELHEDLQFDFRERVERL